MRQAIKRFTAVMFHSRQIRTIASRARQLCCAGVLALTLQARASDDSATNAYSCAPPESWVKPQFYDVTAPSLADATADEYLLLQEQQINAAEQETFYHTDRQILTSEGVQNDSTITVNFNPNYQSLVFHWVRIWRGKDHLDRLDTNKIEILQQEKDMDQYQLNGEKSAILVLDDVRVGDIIDCAYSLKGENPVFRGHFASLIPVQMEEPAGRLFTRILWPRQKGLYAKAHNCSVQPSLIPGKSTNEFTWDFRQVPAITAEDQLPAWYDPDQWVLLSDFKFWAEVNQWAMALFPPDSSLSRDLSQKISEWKQLDDPEAEILAALRFVQEEVRYFGIEIGVGTEKPADPSTVFSRRFGDCKDKSLLFVSILRALGIQAYPVLVNATVGRGINDWQPSAIAFDHCIVQVQCNGQLYWVDPTMNDQRGPLAMHFLPDYGPGLVVAPGTTELTTAPQNTGSPTTTTTEYFTIRGASRPSDLKVVTVAEGRDAEVLRQIYATEKLTEIQARYTHLYSTIYPKIKMSSPMLVEDNEEQNRFQTTAFFSIDDVWGQPDKNQGYSCQFYPVSISRLFDKPDNTDRRQPLAVDFPQHQILRTEVTLPVPMPFAASDRTISGPSFTFRKFGRSAGERLMMEYEYQSLADSVSPDDVSDYLQRLDDCSKILGDTVVWH